MFWPPTGGKPVDRKIRITTLRTIGPDGQRRDGVCSDKWKCPGLHRVDGQPERTYVVLKQVDTAEAAAFAPLLGDGEIVGWVPTRLLEGGV
jgi:hypothetical protein